MLQIGCLASHTVTPGLQLPQTPPILNTDVYYPQLVSIYMGTHAAPHTHTHAAFTCADMFCWLFSTPVCMCVCVRTMGGLYNEIFKAQLHIACEVLEVRSSKGEETKQSRIWQSAVYVHCKRPDSLHFLSLPVVVCLDLAIHTMCSSSGASGPFVTSFVIVPRFWRTSFVNRHSFSRCQRRANNMDLEHGKQLLSSIIYQFSSLCNS